MLRLLSFLFLLIAFLGDVFSQDSHYWTEQYGTRSMLLSNSVVGSVEDLGAVYYNPARLSLIDNPSFMISAKVYQLNKTVFENPTGDKNAPIIKSDFGGVPSLVSGVFKISWLKNHRFAYAFLNRRSSDLNLSSGTETYGEVLANMPGNEHYSGEVALGKRFNEEWMGGSWSHAFKPNFSVGASGFFTTRNQSANMDTQLQALSEAGDVRSYLHRTGYNYTLNGLIFKVGAAWEVERLKLGVTVTSPMIILRGSGGFLHEVYYAGSGDVKPIYERNIQGGVKLKYHTPVSIALGGGVKLYKGLFQFSCEYYRRVGAYSLMQGTEFVGQSSGVVRQPELIDQLGSVFNYGIGYNVSFNERISAYLSYSSDFSAAIPQESNASRQDNYIVASTFSTDVYHMGAGFVLNLSWADVTLGATRASATFKMDRPIGFPDGVVVGDVNTNAYSAVDWSRYRFIVGISVPFIKNYAKKLEKKIGL